MNTVASHTRQEYGKNFSVGDRVNIDGKEWKIAEQVGQRVVLYRERIDGSSAVKRLTLQEIKQLLAHLTK
jgi:hypothetical protein